MTSMAVVLGACVIATYIAGARSWAPPLAVSVGVAVAVRVLVAVLARDHTPGDVLVNFHLVATHISAGRDPLIWMQRFTWNFLPVMPYLWSLLLHLHLPWEMTDKIPAIAADCVNTALVAAIAQTRKPLRAFQYAVSPLAILTVAWHGQVEPIALMCILGALIVLRREKYGVAGALMGLAVAIKTWPILFTFALLRGTPPRKTGVVLGALVAVPLAFFLTMPLLTDANLSKDASVLLGYRSYVGVGGWTGVVRIHANWHYLGYSGHTQELEQHIGLGLFALALIFVFWVWRRAEPEILALAVLLMFVVVTPGFAKDYLMWPLPLAIAFATPPTWLYIWPASMFAALGYLTDTPMKTLIYLSLVVVCGAFVALPFDQRFGSTRASQNRARSRMAG